MTQGGTGVPRAEGPPGAAAETAISQASSYVQPPGIAVQATSSWQPGSPRLPSRRTISSFAAARTPMARTARPRSTRHFITGDLSQVVSESRAAGVMPARKAGQGREAQCWQAQPNNQVIQRQHAMLALVLVHSHALSV
jgi:hypothetical protein